MESNLNGVSTAITFGPDNAQNYGTTSAEFKLWLDYVYDRFGVTLDRRMRRYIVSLGMAAIVFLAGLLTALPFGLLSLYLTTPGVYFFTLGIAWYLGSLRWLSQSYHVQFNIVRPCFPVDDSKYKAIVRPYADRATHNRAIVVRSILVSLIFCAYFAVVYLGPDNIKSALLFGFPRSFAPIWHSGASLIPKMIILDEFCIAASFGIYTGAHIMLETLPLFSKFATLPVVPFPQVVNDLFVGVLTVYSTGALMWSFGIVLAELIYNTQLDVIGVSFSVLFAALGLVAFFWPRQAVRRTWMRSSEEAVNVLMNRYYSDEGNVRSINELTRINKYIRSVTSTHRSGFQIDQVFNLTAGQLLPLLTLAFNTLISHHIFAL
ncbi:MAG TPA: hypothetical protein VGF38_20790 [Ktedonobacterales bacterium]|jgi:hypothetical protein